MSSYTRARNIALLLKGRIRSKQFFLSDPVAPLPSADSGMSIKPLLERTAKKK